MVFFLFLLFALAMQIYLTAQLIRQPEHYNASSILSILMGSSKNYMILSFPFLFLFSAALCVSNISLIRHEGFRGVNVLGIILSFLLIGVMAADAISVRYEPEPDKDFIILGCGIR